LAAHFLDRINAERNKQVEGLSEEVLDALCAYRWPGNVRELENLIERVVVLRSTGEITLEDLPAKYREGAPADSRALPSIGPEGIDFNQTVDRLEAHMILEALELTDWNKNRAAQLLGLNRTTLLEKIKKKGLQPGEPAPGSPTATNS
jgi:DNA-binding NtrC family response regulator